VSKVRVLQFSSRSADNCGVGKYQENFVNVFNDTPDDIETKFFESSPYKTRIMNQDELDEVIGRLKKELSHYDILHIQHEFGLYSGTEFAQLVAAAKEVGKKVVVTVHLSPALAFKFKPREGIGPRSLVNYLRQKRLHLIFKKRHIYPMQNADLLITHNAGATNSLISYGVEREKILQILHPVLPFTKPSATSTEIAQKLDKKSGDVIYSTVGFMHKHKGIQDAVKALKYLPENYKLAIIGGMQPISDEHNIYNKITDLIDALDLKKRVYITGFVEDDDRLNALIRETDICVYPYNNAYYGQVSSGALNLAFANERPVIAYPTDSFKESNKEFEQIVLTNTPAYYELARELQQLHVSKQLASVKDFAQKYSWPEVSNELIRAFRKLI
jgi:glycosyltransferase involved in cell wall biosynthesis